MNQRPCELKPFGNPAAISVLFLTAFLGGCACSHGSERSFEVPRDSFAYQNELRWSYEFGSPNEVEARPTNPPPEYSLRCFPMVRAAREFFYHAGFEPNFPKTNALEYKRLVRQVIHRNSRCPSTNEDRIVIPGFADLHEFSAAYPELLKAECGSAWSSFFQRGNWRMVLPLTRRGEAKIARRFSNELRNGRVPIAHVYRFPDTSLNHAVLIYDQASDANEIIFTAYDPNNPARPSKLRYDRATRTFFFERNQYFAGGAVKVYEVYRGFAF
jgi:hypothetical protein